MFGQLAGWSTIASVKTHQSKIYGGRVEFAASYLHLGSFLFYFNMPCLFAFFFVCIFVFFKLAAGLYLCFSYIIHVFLCFLFGHAQDAASHCHYHCHYLES